MNQGQAFQLKEDAMSVIEIIVSVMMLLVYVALLVLEIFTMLGSNEKLRTQWWKGADDEYDK